jgi:outer membrane biosynthesis protein TonB
MKRLDKNCAVDPFLALCIGIVLLVTGCRNTPKPGDRQMTAAKTTVPTLTSSQSNSTPASDDCGLTAYPVSRSAKEILSGVPRESSKPSSSLFAKIAIDPQGKITHLRVLSLAHPEASFSEEINEQAVDAIKRWHYKPTLYDGKPVAVCSDVSVIIDLAD